MVIVHKVEVNTIFLDDNVLENAVSNIQKIFVPHLYEQLRRLNDFYSNFEYCNNILVVLDSRSPVGARKLKI